MPAGWMDEATWDAAVDADRRRMAQELFGRDDILPGIPGSVVGPNEWTTPNQNPHGRHTYPVRDRQKEVAERADKIMMENPGAYTPEMAVEMAEREVPQYSPSEQRQVAMERYYRQQGYDPGNARQRAQMEEEDAWRQRGRAARRPVPASGGRQTPPGQSRTSGANLPLPVDREVPFGAPASPQGMPPVEPGLDPARVAEVAATMPGIPPEEAWQRAQLALMRGPGRGGAPASAPQPRVDDPWSGRTVPDGYDAVKVRELATYYVRSRRMSPDQAWNLALVDVSRDTREGTTSTNAELSSRLEGGRGNERRSPNSTVPGVNDPTGVPTRVSREMSGAEAAEYNRRSPPREGGEATAGGYEYSQRDRDNMARGLIPVQTPEGVRYMESAEPEGNMPGRPGVPGVRPDLVERGYEVVAVNDVTGRPRRVYQYTAAGAEKANRTRPADWGGAQGGTPFAINQRLRALAEQAGIPVEEARALVESRVAESQKDDDPSNDIVMGSQAFFQPLRDMAATRSQNDRLARIQNVRRNAMLAGGQPTGGPGGTIAATNALGMLPQEWQNQVLANRLTGGDIGGATPLDVQAAHNQQLSALGLRVATGQGFAEGNAAAQQMQMQMQLRQEERMTELRKAAADARQWARFWGSSEEVAARDALEALGAEEGQIELILGNPSGEEAGPPPPPFNLPSPWPTNAGPGSTGPGGLRVPPGATPYRTGP